MHKNEIINFVERNRFFSEIVFYDEILQRNSTGNQMVFCISTTTVSNQEEQKNHKKNDDNFQKLYQNNVF